MKDSGDVSRVRPDLTAVPETLLYNVYHRALAASSRHPIISDRKAIELVERIDYPFERFKGDPGGQWHTLRILKFDREIQRFLDRHPAGTVVALGEGLETQFWRIDNGQVKWLTVDLPEAVELRQALLTDGPRQLTLACSASDLRWMDHVDPSRGLMITAQGLLMYFQPSEVHWLIESCGQRFPGQTLLFDAVPQSMVSRMRSGKKGVVYQPPWVWGIDAEEHGRLAALPSVAEFVELAPARGRGLVFGLALPMVRRVPGMRERLPEFPVFRMTLTAEPTPSTNHSPVVR